MRRGFTGAGQIEALLLILGASAVIIFIFGDWLSRTFVILVPLVFITWCYWHDRRYMRFRVGDRVRVITGDHAGTLGDVISSKYSPYGARVKLDKHNEIVDFPMGRGIERIR